MKKWITFIGLLISCNSFAHTFNFDECIFSSEWIGLVTTVRDHPYEEIDNTIRNHMDGLLQLAPEKIFLKDFKDEDYFFKELKDAYYSKKTSDEAQTDYITGCIK